MAKAVPRRARDTWPRESFGPLSWPGHAVSRRSRDLVERCTPALLEHILPCCLDGNLSRALVAPSATSQRVGADGRMVAAVVARALVAMQNCDLFVGGWIRGLPKGGSRPRRLLQTVPWVAALTSRHPVSAACGEYAALRGSGNSRAKPMDSSRRRPSHQRQRETNLTM